MWVILEKRMPSRQTFFLSVSLARARWHGAAGAGAAGAGAAGAGAAGAGAAATAAYDQPGVRVDRATHCTLCQKSLDSTLANHQFLPLYLMTPEPHSIVFF
jgi:hypothetical protein